MSSAFSSRRSRASLSGAASLPKFGAFAPACEVVKNTGSIRSKSRSARMRSISTEPTMPRHPINPTHVVISIRLLTMRERRDHGVAHFNGADFAATVLIDVAGAQAVGQHAPDRTLDAACRLLLIERIAHQHRGRQNRPERVSDIL